MSRLIGLISGSLEVVTAFGDGEEVADVAESLRHGVEAAGGPFSQQRLEFGEGHLDRVEIGRIGRQEQEPSTTRFDQVFGPFAFMEADVVENDDIARRQGRGELRFDPGVEDAPVHRRIDDPRRNHPMRSQASDEGLGFPGAERRMTAVASPLLRPSRALGQFRVGRRLIDKDQSRQGLVEEAPAPSDPQLTRLGDLRTLVLACP